MPIKAVPLESRIMQRTDLLQKWLDGIVHQIRVLLVLDRSAILGQKRIKQYFDRLPGHGSNRKFSP